MAVVEDEYNGAGLLSAAPDVVGVPVPAALRTTSGGLGEDQGQAQPSRRGAGRYRVPGWIYDWLQNLAPLRVTLALRHARAVLSFERRLGIAPEHFLDHWLAHQHFLAYIASDFYDNAIFGVTLGLAAWTWWHRPDIYRPLRNDLVLANLIGFAVFWLYPLAPPRMLPGFIDVVAKVGGLGPGTTCSFPTPTSWRPCPPCTWPGRCGAHWWSGAWSRPGGRGAGRPACWACSTS